MTLRNSFFFLFFLLLSSTLSAQIAFWQTYLGGSALDRGKEMFVQPDGTIIIAGETYSQNDQFDGNHSSNGDIVIFKYSTQGNFFWKSYIGGSETESLGDLHQTSDGGFILVGTTKSSDGDLSLNRGGSDIMVAKLDAKARIEWVRTLGTKYNDHGNAVRELPNGDYLLGGDIGAPKPVGEELPHAGYECYLARLSPTGNVKWTQYYGGTGNEKVVDIQVLGDNNFLIISNSDSKDLDVGQSMGEKDAWLFMIDGAGEMIWQTSFGGEKDDDIQCSIIDREGNIVMGGTTFSQGGLIQEQKGNGDIWMVKLTPKGQLIWSKTFGGSRAEGINDIRLTRDDQYIVCGLTKSRTTDGDIELNQGYFDGWLLKISEQGTRLWSRTIGYEGKDVLTAIQALPEGGFLALGYAKQDVKGFPLPGFHGGTDMWLCNFGDPFNGKVKPFVTPPVLVGTIKDRKTGRPIEATITLTDNRTLDSLTSTNSDPMDGTFTLLMPAYGLVSINVMGEGYMFFGQNYQMDTIVDRNQLNQEILLDPIRIGAKLILKNIYFETGQWDLLPASYAEMARVKAFMDKNPRVKVQISGHTDNTGNKQSKMRLSENRAGSVKRFLIAKGVSQYRMQIKGFGMYRPIAPNTTSSGRKKNRRVEFEIVSK
ncbi:MAG: OmpA family protein [Bacteroidota bacterium]